MNRRTFLQASAAAALAKAAKTREFVRQRQRETMAVLRKAVL